MQPHPVTQPKTLIIGYGNVDREDDGVAWHILQRLAQRLGRDFPEDPEDELPELDGANPALTFALQLTPEMAETFADFERVCFIDAHTGAVPHEINWEQLRGVFQASPLTHHTTPQTCVSLVESLYFSHPEAVLVSVRGYRFGFARALSPQTTGLAEAATERILEWVGVGEMAGGE